MPKFFVFNSEGDAVAVEQITNYAVYPAVEDEVDEDGDAKRPLRVRFYHGADYLGQASGMYAVDWLNYAGARNALADR